MENNKTSIIYNGKSFFMSRIDWLKREIWQGERERESGFPILSYTKDRVNEMKQELKELEMEDNKETFRTEAKTTVQVETRYMPRLQEFYNKLKEGKIPIDVRLDLPELKDGQDYNTPQILAMIAAQPITFFSTQKDILARFIDILKDDPEYRETFKANIAVCFIDEFDKHYDKYEHDIIGINMNEVTNKAAENFIDKLTETNNTHNE